MIGFVLAAGQLVVRHRVLPAWFNVVACSVIGPTLALTYSRGAWLGAVAGVSAVVALRRPALLLSAAIAGSSQWSPGWGAGS